jgi:hypothetical protein
MNFANAAEVRRVKEFSSANDSSKFRTCFISTRSNAPFASDGLPCVQASFFFAALIKSFTSLDLVGFPCRVPTFQQGNRSFGMKCEIAFFQNINEDARPCVGLLFGPGSGLSNGFMNNHL